MAGKFFHLFVPAFAPVRKPRFASIDVVDLTRIIGGAGDAGGFVDKQTRAAQQVLDQATAAAQNVAKAVAPKDDSMSQVMMRMMNNQRSGSGPASAPAPPPTRS